jgi:diguanylate cyclase (GGDEF)-like protein/PAS domain S-box-containing protein
MSIKFKLALPTLFALVFIVTAIQFFWQPLQLDKAKNLFIKHTNQLLTLGETGITQNLLKKDFGSLFSNMEQLELVNQKNWSNITLYDEKRKQIYPILSSKSEVTAREKDIILIVHPLKASNKTIGYIELDANWGEERLTTIEYLNGIRNMIIYLFILVLLVNTLRQYQVIYRPLKTLVQATNKIKGGNLKVELPTYINDELGELIEDFGAMLDELTFQRSALDQHSIVSITDKNGVITDINNKFIVFSGYTRDELIGKKHSIIRSDIHSAEFYGNMWSTISRGAVWQGEFCNQKKNGELFWVRSTIVPFLNSRGSPERYISIRTDITDQKIEIKRRKQAELLLMKQSRRLEYILSGTNAGTWEWEVQTGGVQFNERWADIVGYTLEELSPVSIETWMNFAHPDDLEMSSKLLEKHFSAESDYYECEVRMRHKNGEWVWVLDRGKVFTWTDDGKPLLMCGTHQEINDRKQYEARIHYLATHDELTGLPNLRVAKDRMEIALKHAKRNQMLVAVMFLDLDGFKIVNDVNGHDAGDFVLKETAARFKACLRQSDTLARIGGDEFLIILEGLTSPCFVEQVSEKLIYQVAEKIEFKGEALNIGVSIGISLYPKNGNNFDSLIKVADDAMYVTKKSGKNGYTSAKQ